MFQAFLKHEEFTFQLDQKLTYANKIASLCGAFTRLRPHYLKFSFEGGTFTQNLDVNPVFFDRFLVMGFFSEVVFLLKNRVGKGQKPQIIGAL